MAGCAMSKKEEGDGNEKQSNRHVEKEKQKNARISAEELRKKKEHEERAKRLAEEDAKYQESREQQRQQSEELKRAQMQQAHRELAERMFKQSIINEFTTAVAIHKTPDRAFRKLSLKYHPDKNPENRERAEKIQKILVDIREMYSV